MTVVRAAKSVARVVLQCALPSAPKFMLQSLTNVDMLMTRPLLVQRGDLDFSVGSSILYGGFWSMTTWEEGTYRIMRRFLRDSQSYIDIGAWIGPTVLYGAQLARHAYAIEPDPVAIRYLRRNLELNPQLNGRITIVESCIGDGDGTARLGVSRFLGDSESSLLLGNKRDSQAVKSMRFDTLIRKYEIDDCNFVKMDIEGGEFLVLPTMAGFLSKEKPTLCLSIHPKMSNDLENDLNRIADTLQGYEFVFSGQGSPVNLDDLRNGIAPKGLLIVATDEKNALESDSLSF